MSGGGGHHGAGHRGGFRRGGHGWVRRGWRGGWYGPGFIDYVAYSPCSECWSQPPSLVLPCLRYRGCVAPYGLGQTETAVVGVGVAGVVGVGLVGAGVMWWLKSRKKRK